MNDQAPSDATTDSFVPPSPEKTRVILEKMKHEGYPIGRLGEYMKSAGSMQDLTKLIGDEAQEAHADVPKLLKHLESFTKEGELKKKWMTWDKVKEIGSRGWEWAKKNKWLIAGVLFGTLVLAAYYTEAGSAAIAYVERKAGEIMAKAGLGNAVETAKDAIGTGVEKVGAAAEKGKDAFAAAKGAVGDALGGAPGVPDVLPTPAALPTSIPSMDESKAILDALGKAG